MLVPSFIQLFIYFIVEQGAHSKGKYLKAESNNSSNKEIILYIGRGQDSDDEFYCLVQSIQFCVSDIEQKKHYPQNEDLRQFNVADKIFMKPCRFILTTCSAFKKAIHAYTFSQHLFRLKANVQKCFMTPLALSLTCSFCI